ncbi:MAG: hypothetical protein NT117_00050 [Gammaproteobacteria bacterium]|nr:hypothetical protein [Gammaproteobacteria bacterium]
MTQPEHHESRIEKATESTMAKVVARFVVPILLTIIGWLLIDGLGDLRSNVKSQGADIVLMKSDVRDLNTRLDAQVLRQVETNTKTIETHERRIQAIERAVKVP